MDTSLVIIIAVMFVVELIVVLIITNKVYSQKKVSFDEKIDSTDISIADVVENFEITNRWKH